MIIAAIDENHPTNCYWSMAQSRVAICWWLMASFHLISKHESERRECCIMKSAASPSFKQLSMPNMSFLDFCVLSQQITGSISAWWDLHNAVYIKEIQLCASWRSIQSHLPGSVRRHMAELHQKKSGFLSDVGVVYNYFRDDVHWWGSVSAAWSYGQKHFLATVQHCLS